MVWSTPDGTGTKASMKQGIPIGWLTREIQKHVSYFLMSSRVLRSEEVPQHTRQHWPSLHGASSSDSLRCSRQQNDAHLWAVPRLDDAAAEPYLRLPSKCNPARVTYSSMAQVVNIAGIRAVERNRSFPVTLHLRCSRDMMTGSDCVTGALDVVAYLSGLPNGPA